MMAKAEDHMSGKPPRADIDALPCGFRILNIPLEFGRGILKKFRIFRQGTIL
jgi:hypothetical protein